MTSSNSIPVLASITYMDLMPESIINTSNMNDINDAMNFETELIKSKGRISVRNPEQLVTKKKMNFFKKLFSLKISNKSSTKKFKLPTILSAKNKSSKKESKKEKIAKRMFAEERLIVWNEIGMKESKNFHKSDKLIKLKLSKIIPSEISHRR